RGHPEGVAAGPAATHAGIGAAAAARGRLRPGGDLMSEEIVSELMRAHVYRLASTGQRVDGRVLDEPRKVAIQRSFVKTAEGSARAKLGNTDILVGIKMSVGEPYPDTPNTGVLSTSVELIPMASPTFEAGPPRPDAIELARMADARITVTTDENEDIRAMQKGLSGSFSYDEVKRIIETAQRVGRAIRPVLRSS